jgi:hypothetical protein
MIDGPITNHPQFGWIQWNQSHTHMPWERRVRAAGVERAANCAEPMDMDEEAAKEEVAEEEAAYEEVVKEEETVTVGASHYWAI